MKKITLLALTLATFACNSAFARDKTDVVLMENGDRISGEIKDLVHGKLRLDTDSLGMITIVWNDISRIESEYEFQFERTDGTRVTGTIDESTEQHEIVLVGEQQTITFAHDNIVRISQMEDTFWERVDGSLTFGYSFTKASDVAQGNLGFHVSHRTEIRSLDLDGGTILTSDQANQNTQRSTLLLSNTRFRANRWFNKYIMGFERNDELGLNLRSSLGAGIGRYLVQTNMSEFSITGGLVGTAEDLDPVDNGGAGTTGVSSQESLEGMLGIEYSRYIFDDPTVDLNSRLYVFPSITESGRTRAQLDINFRWELINDLFWDLTYYNTYDSDPPSGSDSTRDYGIVTSIGYAF